MNFYSGISSNAGTGGLGLATFLLGDVGQFQRYYSTSLDASERQWRTFSTVRTLGASALS